MKTGGSDVTNSLEVLRLKSFSAAHNLFLGLMLCVVGLAAGEENAPSAGENKDGSSSNILTVADQAAGWKLLFDGKSTQGWRGFRRKDFPVECWVVGDGALKRVGSKGSKKRECGDIITLDQYDNFELELEWRIVPGGNSGFKYLVPEDRPSTWEQALAEYRIQELKKAASPNPGEIAKEVPEKYKKNAVGFEFQIIDDEKNADARKDSKRITGALYDLLAPSRKASSPVGEFNLVRLLVKGNHVEHWINGVKVLEFERDGQQLKTAIAESKFRGLDGFGTISRGHIALQDHGDEVWFRNIKIRKLRAE